MTPKIVRREFELKGPVRAWLLDGHTDEVLKAIEVPAGARVRRPEFTDKSTRFWACTPATSGEWGLCEAVGYVELSPV
jgi:hypothetical protein